MLKNFSNFNFHMYTEIVFGKNTESSVGNLIKKYGGTKVMFVYGGGSIKRSGLYDRVLTALNDSELPYVELSGVKPNPRRSLVEKGLKIAVDESVDFLLAVGGGSTIDTAKSIALGLANEGDYWKFFQGEKPEKMYPVGTIHTIAAAGSETSGSAVLVDDIENGTKEGFLYDTCRPKFAIMNPELTYSVSKYQTGAGAADIFSHTVNRYFVALDSFLGDQYCTSTLRTIVKYGPICVKEPTNYEARAEMMITGSFSHNDLTSLGRESDRKGNEHALEQQLSGKYDTAHGAGLSVVMPAWLEYIVDHGRQIHVDRVAQFAVDVFGVYPEMGNKVAVAKEGLNRFREWLKSLGMPLTLKELGIEENELDSIVNECACDENGIQTGFMDLNKTDVRAIFESALK